MMVRVVGLEPTLLAERDFESRASTNFTTPAAWPHALAHAHATRKPQANTSATFSSFGSGPKRFGPMVPGRHMNTSTTMPPI